MIDTLKLFLKKNWLTMSVFVLSLLPSFYFYEQSIKERIPTFIVNDIRTVILRKKDLSETPIKVFREDGSPIADDLTAVNFFFWNDGREPIKIDHLFENIIIGFKDTTVQIVDYKILKISRPITGIGLTTDHLHPGKLILYFRILEKGDGLSCQLIYSGNPNAKLEINGAIEGVKNFQLEPSAGTIWVKNFWRSFILILSSLVVFFLFSPFENLAKRAAKPIKKKIYELVFGISRLIFGLALVFGVLIIVMTTAYLVLGMGYKPTDYIPDEIMHEERPT